MREYEIIHRVTRGQTLSQIATVYGVPMQCISVENQLEENVYEGQMLVIPPVCGKVYRVRPDDTVQSLAHRFGISEQKLLKDNNAEFIYPFMDLVIKGD